MHLAYTAEQEELRRRLRDYFAALVTTGARDDLLSEDGARRGATYRSLIKQMGSDGWLGMGWPREYGGLERPMLDQLIFHEEATTAGAPLPLLTLNSVGPTLMEFGSPQQKGQLLPGIVSGDLHFAIGYSEPDAGTDLAALRTSAVKDGDHYVINGTKMWTSAVEVADYVWLAARTNPEAHRHRGISVFLVPTSSPGFSYTPVHTLGGTITSQTFYDDVRVPVSALVGPEGGGWPLVTGQLNRERVALCSPAGVMAALADTVEWARTTKLPDGRRVIDQEWVQVNLGRVHAKAEFLKLINWKIAWAVGDRLRRADASATKVFGTEFATEAYRLLMECIGDQALIRRGGPGAVAQGRVERAARSALTLTFGGGTNEIQRDLIAWSGLGLPRHER